MTFGISNGSEAIQAVITGTYQDDNIYGTSLNERIDALTGSNTVHGGGGHDDIFGDGQIDVLYGEDGNDYIDGRGGDDLIYGGDGNDELEGYRQYDDIYGGNGNDFIKGGAETDELYGEDGNDTIWGGMHEDKIYSGEGKDIIRGDDPYAPADGVNASSDVFYFDEGWSGLGVVDTIMDFNFGGTHDRISLTMYDAKSSKNGDQSFVQVDHNENNLAAGELTVVRSEADVFVRGNTDGDGQFELEIKLANYSGSLDDVDFLL